MVAISVCMTCITDQATVVAVSMLIHSCTIACFGVSVDLNINYLQSTLHLLTHYFITPGPDVVSGKHTPAFDWPAHV